MTSLVPHMEIGLCWYQKRTNNKWTCDYMNHLMLDLKIIIAISSMTHIIDLNAYELHLGDEKVSNEFVNEC